MPLHDHEEGGGREEEEGGRRRREGGGYVTCENTSILWANKLNEVVCHQNSNKASCVFTE